MTTRGRRPRPPEERSSLWFFAGSLVLDTWSQELSLRNLVSGTRSKDSYQGTASAVPQLAHSDRAFQALKRFDAQLSRLHFWNDPDSPTFRQNQTPGKPKSGRTPAPRPGFFRLQSPGPSLAELLVANAHSRVLGQFAGTVATSMRRTAPAGISCTAMPCATSVPSFRTRWE